MPGEKFAQDVSQFLSTGHVAAALLATGGFQLTGRAGGAGFAATFATVGGTTALSCSLAKWIVPKVQADSTVKTTKGAFFDFDAQDLMEAGVAGVIGVSILSAAGLSGLSFDMEGLMDLAIVGGSCFAGPMIASRIAKA